MDVPLNIFIFILQCRHHSELRRQQKSLPGPYMTGLSQKWSKNRDTHHTPEVGGALAIYIGVHSHKRRHTVVLKSARSACSARSAGRQ